MIFLWGMYAAHSAWIDYEISEAQGMGRPIIGVQPWGQQRVPVSVQNASTIPLVGWNKSSIIQAVRNLT